MSSNENPNPFGFNFGNTNVKNSFIAFDSDVKRGNVDIVSVNDPNKKSEGQGSSIENSFIDINATREDGDIRIHEVPPGARLAGPVNRRTPVVAAAQAQQTPTPSKVPVAQVNPVSESKGVSLTQRAGDTVFLLEGTEIRASKDILASKSSVFAAYIKRSLPNTPIALPGIKPNVFEAMLQYFENENDTHSLKQFAEQLLEVGDKFGIPNLKTKCEKVLLENLQADTAVKLLLLAVKNKSDYLKGKAIEYISACPAIQDTDEYRKAMEEEPGMM